MVWLPPRVRQIQCPRPTPWRPRQNAALKLKGHGGTLDVPAGRVRLRPTMPPRPTDPQGSEPEQLGHALGLLMGQKLQRLGVLPAELQPRLLSAAAA